jgi:hypothetical protein
MPGVFTPMLLPFVPDTQWRLSPNTPHEHQPIKLDHPAPRFLHQKNKPAGTLQ